MGNFGIGQAIRRVEDQRFLTGQGRYTDDINIAGQAYLYVLRAPFAHADIARLDCGAARAAPGVIGVFTAAELTAMGIGAIPCDIVPHNRDGSAPTAPRHPILAENRVRYVGEPVAAIVAETFAQARDAAELIEVDYRDLAAVTTADEAMAPAAVILHPKEAPGNLFVDWAIGDEAATTAAFAHAHKIVAIDLVNQRIAPTAMEPRAALSEWDGGIYTLINGSQGVHLQADELSRAMLKVPPEQVRVITPDVGGGFGMKNRVFAEAALCVVAAKSLGRPVKWTADRNESFLNDTHARDQQSHAELAIDRDGRFLGLRISTTANIGAYVSEFGALVPTFAGAPMAVGAYRIPVAFVNVKVVLTNTVPTDAYRGAGRPEAAYLIERLVDRAAREFGLAPDELRRRNFIAPDQFPFTTVLGKNYDSGRYAELMDQALRRADAAGFEDRRARARREGKLRGLGFSYYVEACAGIGSEQPNLNFERDGRLVMRVGTQSNGQGHETVYAQMAADAFGLPLDAITVKQGDTAEIPSGMGTAGSRSLVVAGSAIRQTIVKMIEQGKHIAANMLEASAGDINFADGRFSIAGTDRGVSLRDVATASFDDALRPDGKQPGLHEAENFAPSDSTFPNGCHVCEVEIDEATGAIAILRHTIQDDLGVAMNPLLMEGQILGGAIQGIGQAVCEQVVYDNAGQMLTGSFMDYCMPRADTSPAIDFAYTEVPSPTNPLGAKGAGEAGTIGAMPAVVIAALDALAPVGVRHLEMPLTPRRIWEAISAAKAGR